MTNYIDGFVFPIGRTHLEHYRDAAEKIAEIWREYGALSYFEYINEELEAAGTRAFPEFTGAKEDEVVVFGWMEFASREARDLAHEKVSTDPRIPDLVAPLTDPERMVFDAGRMVHGVFKSFIQLNSSENL